MRRVAKRVAWWLPVTIAFTDLVASVLRVEGDSMLPTLNADPLFSDWVIVEKVRLGAVRHRPAACKPEAGEGEGRGTDAARRGRPAGAGAGGGGAGR